MINYKIHYSSTGFSQQERLAKAETNFLAYIVYEVAKPKHYIIFEKIIKKVVATINELLDAPSGSERKSFFYEIYNYEDFNALAKLLEKIIPDLKGLLKHASKSNDLQQITNQAVIVELEKLKMSGDINPATIMDILVKFKVDGIKNIEFTTGVNQEILADIAFPMDLVPEMYNCNILMTIMSEPIVATPTARIDRVVTAGAKINPFTRRDWLEVEKDAELSKEINGFVKKLEWLYYAFQDNEQYKKLYLDLTIKILLQDHELSYENFKIRVNQYLGNSAILAVTPEAVMQPCKYILDLFSKCDIHVLQHTKQDYEQLIRHLTLLGDAKGLERLLDSSILELVKVNVYSLNNNGQNVLALLNSYRHKRPELRGKHDQCYELLTRYQAPSSNDMPFSCRWLSEQVNNYLPSFSRYTVLATLSTFATIGASVYIGSDNGNLPRATPDL